jgi:outer membrane receptor protein involved in Fe transport
MPAAQTAIGMLNPPLTNVAYCPFQQIEGSAPMKFFVLLGVAPLTFALPAVATAAEKTDPANKANTEKATEETSEAPKKAAFSTGVAKGRDLLDSAISASSLDVGAIEKLGARSLGEVLRNIPGIRAEAQGGEGNASYSIRGLPLASSGSKFMQLQEDGLPVLEFGDIQLFASDIYMRVDRSLSQVEAIRGGSASTFSSNSPGGVINLISKTGEEEGGSVQATSGLGYDTARIDFDYGSKISDSLRFQIGGFYRRGEGPRDVGYDAYKGGQFKVNVTRQFAGGYIRLFAKYLDDKTPSYQTVPVRVTGTNADPKFENLANLDFLKDSLLSRNITTVLTLDGDNNRTRDDLRDGMHAKAKSIGLASQFDIGEWTVSEKFRFGAMSGRTMQNLPLVIAPATALGFAYGGAGAALSFATGPDQGQAIASPATLNGNGLLSTSLIIDATLNSLDNATNDLRISRVWQIGGGALTTTAGIYNASQDYNADWSFATVLSDIRGGGKTALINVTTAGGVPTTQDGFLAYNVGGTGAYHRTYDVNYAISAPYGSVNYHIGKVAVGASIRYDDGKVKGSLYGSELGGGRVGTAPFDMNNDGAISLPESQTALLPLSQPGLVDYGYHYVSYSTGINFRISRPLAVFARYSRGGRAAADRILFTPAINYASGALLDRKDGYDIVRQAELGVKFRQDNLELNLTGFVANTGERNLQVNSRPDGSIQVERIVRGYNAKGAEFEGSYRRGQFALMAGATYTKAKISSDAAHPEFVGNVPRHQATFIFEATPQFETEMFTLGANFVGTTSSYAQDTNQLKLPGYVLVNGFAQVRPLPRVHLMVNANNLFNSVSFAEVTQSAIPASGIVLARANAGRTVSASLRFEF